MLEPKRPPNEDERLEDLATYQILDTLPEGAFDDLAQLAATLCDVPMALITFVDEDRQWNKACVGLDRDPVDREISFCGHVIADPAAPMIVEDTHDDERFHDNPLVTGGPRFRFYAGVPIVSPRGNPLGTVCVLDREPRQVSDDQVDGLRAIADQVTRLLEARAEGLEFAQESRFLQSLIDSLQEHVAILDEGGTIVATNETWDDFSARQGGPVSTYLEVPSTDPDKTQQMAEGIEALIEGEQERFELDFPCRRSGEERWHHLTATVFEDGGHRYVVAAHRDVTAAKRAEDERERLIGRLSERDQTLERLGGTLPQVLWIVDADLDSFDFIGARATEFWDIERETLQEEPLAWLDRLPDPERQRFQTWMADTLTAFEAGDRDAATFEFRFQLPVDDTIRWGRIQAFPIRKEDRLTQIAGITEDTTLAHQENTRQRQRTHQQARLSELEQLAFATSHTLKTEIRRIRSFGQLLSNRAAKGQLDQLDEPIEEMLNGSRRLEALHEGLRKYAEVTQGHAPLQQVDLSAMMQEVLAERSDAIEGLEGRADVGEIP